jgi:hypothetical protein
MRTNHTGLRAGAIWIDFSAYRAVFALPSRARAQSGRQSTKKRKQAAPHFADTFGLVPELEKGRFLAFGRAIVVIYYPHFT